MTTRHPKSNFLSVIRKIAPALCGLALLAASERADADTILVNPSMSTQKINQTISSSKIGDTIEWTKGEYQVNQADPDNGYYKFYEGRDYTFEDGVVIKGTPGLQGGSIFKVFGSDVTITTLGNVIMKDTYNIGMFGDINSPALENVNVSGITSNATGMHYIWQNILNLEDRTEPDIKFSNLVLNGGTIGFNFAIPTYPGNPEGIVNAKTPYISIENTTADGVGATTDGKLTAIPRTSVPGEPRKLLDMQHYIKNNALINTQGITTPTLYQYFNTPENTAQKDVTNPYINPEKNDFTTDDMKFMPGTSYTPMHNSPLNLGEGKYIGACMPEGTARITGASFNITPLNDLHTELRATDLWIEFTGDNMCIQTANGWNADLKYKVEYCIDDHNPNTPDNVLATTTNHMVYLSHDKVSTINPPDFYPQKFLIGVGNHDIYARITSYASDGLDLNIEADREKYFDYTQFAQFESDRVTVTGLPEPATLGLLGLGSFLLLYRKRKE